MAYATESTEDQLFVRGIVESSGIEFVSEAGDFGKDASEAEMRHARYHFLDAVRRSKKAQSVVTAHHQDDVIETAVINLLRGYRSARAYFAAIYPDSV